MFRSKGLSFSCSWKYWQLVRKRTINLQNPSRVSEFEFSSKACTILKFSGSIGVEFLYFRRSRGCKKVAQSSELGMFWENKYARVRQVRVLKGDLVTSRYTSCTVS